MNYVFLVLFLLITRMSFADVLFLDFNNSPKEIEAAKNAAKQRGEKLIIFPDKPMSQSDFYDFGKSLTKKLNELKANNQQIKISSMILSGHDGNGHFGGTNGSISYASLQQVLEAHPDLKESVKSLYLWGCYTSTPGSIINNWKPTFKNLDVIIGYDGSAPANDKVAGHKYLADALVKEKKMTDAKTDQELKSIFNNLAHVKNVHASICKGDTYISNKKMISIQQLKEQCNKAEAEKWGEVYSCYMYGKQPSSLDYKNLDCTDVPANTSNSKLRDMYNYLQDTSHCDEIIGTTSYRNRNQIVRLIYYKRVLKNYFASNKSCVDEVNSFLKKSGSSNQIDTKVWPNLKRSEILKKSAEIRQEISKMKEDDDKLEAGKILNLSKSDVDKRIDQATVSSCESQVMETNDASEYRIPFSWVEDNSKEKSNFLDVSQIRKNSEQEVVSAIYWKHYHSQISESELSNSIDEADVKNFVELQRDLYKKGYNPDAPTKIDARMSELKNKYKDKTEITVNKIKNELPADLDSRLKESIGTQLPNTFEYTITTMIRKYESKHPSIVQIDAQAAAERENPANDEAEAGRRESMRLEMDQAE